jgi:hypothetical protein
LAEIDRDVNILTLTVNNITDWDRNQNAQNSHDNNEPPSPPYGNDHGEHVHASYLVAPTLLIFTHGHFASFALIRRSTWIGVARSWSCANVLGQPPMVGVAHI